MSEDFNSQPGEPETPDSQEERLREEQESQQSGPPAQYPPASEVYIQPEEPKPAGLQYPPPPEFYQQMEVPPPQAAQNPYSTPASLYTVPPVVYEPPTFPPQPAYGYGYDGYAPFPQAQPLPLGHAVRELPGQYKKILFKPGVRSFAEEQSKASWDIIWVQLLFLFVIEVLFSLPSDLRTSNNIVVSLLSTLGLALLTPLFFFGIVGIQYLLARAFKGMGSFKQQAYNQLLFQVPIGVATTIVSLPLTLLVGSTTSSTALTTSTSASSSSVLSLLVLLAVDVVLLAIGVYGVVLNVFSVMAAHRLSGGKAAAAVLIPYGVLLLIACVIVAIGVVAIVSTAAQP